MKWKVGDRVVFLYQDDGKTISEDPSLDSFKKRGTVIELRFGGVAVHFDGEKPPGQMTFHYHWRFQSESVYDSPLNEALR